MKKTKFNNFSDGDTAISDTYGVVTVVKGYRLGGGGVWVEYLIEDSEGHKIPVYNLSLRKYTWFDSVRSWFGFEVKF
jgi:hypothetical protein